jgi:hypothetical protein
VKRKREKTFIINRHPYNVHSFILFKIIGSSKKKKLEATKIVGNYLHQNAQHISSKTFFQKKVIPSLDL